jgi:hypothetical protein
VAECESCSAFVSADYVRVFGKKGVVSACPDCSTIGERAVGDAAAREDNVRWGQ